MTWTESSESNPYAAPESDLTSVEDPAANLPYASIVRRMPAFAIDWFIVQMPMMVVALSWHSVVADSPKHLDICGFVAWILCYVTYCAAGESSTRQATIGKRLLGLTVVDLTGAAISFRTAFYRNLFKILSYVTLFGFLMQPFSQRKQTLHDILAETLVIKR